MADYPVDELNGKTPLETAKKPTLDYLASHGEMGLCKTIPDNMAPGSDVANLSVMGYNPYNVYTGRSPLEAASIGVDLSIDDVTFRANLVTLSDDVEYKNKSMIDYSSDEISSAEGAELIKSLKKIIETDNIKIYAGTSYRNLVVWKGGSVKCELTPPHDISQKQISKYIPTGEGAVKLYEIMEKSYDILKEHPINIKRIKNGLNPANSLWFWGQGKKPILEKFYDKYQLKGAMISAVDLLKGIAVLADMKVVEVEGATGNIHTNFSGKAKAALDSLLAGNDFVYLHIEAADESGHRFEVDNKVKSIEQIDKVTKYIKEGLDSAGIDYSILLLPDHPTPLSIRTHTSDPVPYVIYRRSSDKLIENRGYSEKEAQNTGRLVDKGHTLMDCFLQK